MSATDRVARGCRSAKTVGDMTAIVSWAVELNERMVEHGGDQIQNIAAGRSDMLELAWAPFVPIDQRAKLSSIDASLRKDVCENVVATHAMSMAEDHPRILQARKGLEKATRTSSTGMVVASGLLATVAIALAR